MKMSRRAMRMERHHKRHRSVGTLNLVSLMDIFTILVFFLLVNSSDVDLLPSAKIIELPESVAEQRPRDTAVIMVTRDDILVQGRRVAGVNEVVAEESAGVPALSRALEELTARQLGTPAAGPEVTIMAARELPFSLMKKIMLACTEAKYGQISFAVLHAEEEVGS